jgi:hypothetical protein
MIATNWLQRMNPRERRLAFAVAGILFLLVNIFIWSTLLGMSAETRTQYADRRTERTAQQAYLAEEKMWKQRADWLKKNQPTSNNPAEGSSLLTRVKDVASRYNVQIENPQIGPVENTPSHQSISATFETRSGWEPLFNFLYDSQRHDAFNVFENVTLMVDPNDPTVMQGRFKIAKWFAPTGKR